MVLWLLTLLPLLAWVYLLAFHGGFWRSDQYFVPSSIPGLPQWPAVAAIVPARNEEGTIAAVLRSLMVQDYPGPMQIILLDDRSTDATAAQARSAIAARPSANHAIMLTGEPLPAGWAGKLWAQQQGIAGNAAGFNHE